MSEDRCVCCGAVVPEGHMACPQCLVCVRPISDNITVSEAEEVTE